MSSPPLRVLEPGRRRRPRRELDLFVGFVLALAAIGLLTLTAGVIVLGVLVGRGLA